MNLATARNHVYASLLHAPRGDSGFSVDRVDHAIAFIGEDFANATRCVRATDTIALTAAGTNPVNFTATPAFARFLDIHFIEADIAGAAVKLNPNRLSVKRKATLTGQPTQIAFEGPPRAWLSPKPNANYTLSVHRWMPFTQWTIGTDETTAATTALNIPDQYLLPALRFGATTVLVYGDPRSLYTSAGWQNYLLYRNQVAADYNPSLNFKRQIDEKVYSEPPQVAA